MLLQAFLSFISHVFGQQLKIDFPIQDLGKIEQVNSIQVEYIITNPFSTKIYLMRADAEPGVKVKAGKKTILPGDTTLIQVFYPVELPGDYEKTVKLVISAVNDPVPLKFKAKVLSVKSTGSTACYTFHKASGKPALVVVPELKEAKPVITQNVQKPIYVPVPKDTVQALPETSQVVLNPLIYKPNNLVFIIDNSGSMAKDHKFELLKKALDSLINIVRPQDKISFLTFADSVILHISGANSDKKTELKNIVSKLKVKGITRGAKAVLAAEDVAIDNYIPEGMNQVFLVTDGKFPFYKGHYVQWLSKKGDKQLFLSTIAIGNDKEGVENLKNIASYGDGAFVKIKNEGNIKDLIDKIKEKSKR